MLTHFSTRLPASALMVLCGALSFCMPVHAQSRVIQNAFIDASGNAIPLARISLLLPERSGALGSAADALRAGFFAAYSRFPSGIQIEAVETANTAAAMTQAYQELTRSSDIIVGPLSRAGLSAIIQQPRLARPTIALTQPDDINGKEPPLPANLLPIGLSLENEARQVARSNADQYVNGSVLVVGINQPGWEQRVGAAYIAEATSIGLHAEYLPVAQNNGLLDPATLEQIQQQVQTAPPTVIFAAMGARQASQLRQALGPDVPMTGISQLNTQALRERNAIELQRTLENVTLIDLPWMVQPLSQVVRRFPDAPIATGLVRNPDLERLYALGIDAYLVARETALQHANYTLDGVTGQLKIRFTPGSASFVRQEPWATFRDGVAVPIGTDTGDLPSVP